MNRLGIRYPGPVSRCGYYATADARWRVALVHLASHRAALRRYIALAGLAVSMRIGPPREIAFELTPAGLLGIERNPALQLVHTPIGAATPQRPNQAIFSIKGATPIKGNRLRSPDQSTEGLLANIERTAVESGHPQLQNVANVLRTTLIPLSRQTAGVTGVAIVEVLEGGKAGSTVLVTAKNAAQMQVAGTARTLARFRSAFQAQQQLAAAGGLPIQVIGPALAPRAGAIPGA